MGPVLTRTLYDAQGINPQEAVSQPPSSQDSVLECSWHRVHRQGLNVVLDIVFEGRKIASFPPAVAQRYLRSSLTFFSYMKPWLAWFSRKTHID